MILHNGPIGRVSSFNPGFTPVNLCNRGQELPAGGKKNASNLCIELSGLECIIQAIPHTSIRLCNKKQELPTREKVLCKKNFPKKKNGDRGSMRRIPSRDKLPALWPLSLLQPSLLPIPRVKKKKNDEMNTTKTTPLGSISRYYDHLPSCGCPFFSLQHTFVIQCNGGQEPLSG